MSSFDQQQGLAWSPSSLSAQLGKEIWAFPCSREYPDVAEGDDGASVERFLHLYLFWMCHWAHHVAHYIPVWDRGS